MLDIPVYLQDTRERLSNDGFATSDIWYHGTSSALVDSILEHGLKRSGDKAMKQAVKQTMATIGDKTYSEAIEPVFLSPSKALAYYWAGQTVKRRGNRFGEDEQPVVLEVRLSADEVKPDVGAAGLLMVGGDDYLAFVAELYETCNLPVPSVDPLQADRMEYLAALGMAFCDRDIEADKVSLIKP